THARVAARSRASLGECAGGGVRGSLLCGARGFVVTAPVSSVPAASGWKLPHLRWWIAGLLFLASILNYIDRQTLSILAPTIQQELALTDTDYALVVNCFLVAYTVAMLLSGRVVDHLGVRLSLALFV